MQYLKSSGGEIYLHKDQINLEPLLEKGVYQLNYNALKGGYYLSTLPSFNINKKLYGNPRALTNRYLETFKELDKNLGCLFIGMKGSGKTLTAQVLLEDSNLPIIVVNSCFEGVDSTIFNDFLTSITQNVAVFFDEFEKVYDDRQQEELLTVLDGSCGGKKLFVFTCNGTINYYLMNRPGRIRYKQEYNTLEESIIKEYISDNLIHKEYQEELEELIVILDGGNMDILCTLVDEVNRFKQSPKEVIKYLNVDIGTEDYTATLYDINDEFFAYIDGCNHPLSNKELSLNFRQSYVENESPKYYKFTIPNTKEFTNKNGKFIYTNKEGYKIVFNKHVPYRFTF
jgi:hypothetical protein